MEGAEKLKGMLNDEQATPKDVEYKLSKLKESVVSWFECTAKLVESGSLLEATRARTASLKQLLICKDHENMK